MFKIIFKVRLSGQAVDDWKTPGRNDAGNDRSFFSLHSKSCEEEQHLGRSTTTLDKLPTGYGFQNQKMFKIIFKERLTGQAVDDWKTPGRNDAGNDRSFFSLHSKSCEEEQHLGRSTTTLDKLPTGYWFQHPGCRWNEAYCTALLVDNVDVQS